MQATLLQFPAELLDVANLIASSCKFLGLKRRRA